MTTHLRYYEDDHNTPASDHDEYVADLVYNTTEYFRSMASGDTTRLDIALRKFRDTERAYSLEYGNPRDIIDPEDPAVINAHSELVAGLVFTPPADKVASSHARIIDLDNDRIANQYQAHSERESHRNSLARQAEIYRSAYPTGPGVEFLVAIRRALSARTSPQR